VKGDINKALEVFYAFTGLNAVANRENGVIDSLNRQAPFWNTLVYSLQTTLFIVMDGYLTILRIRSGRL